MTKPMRAFYVFLCLLYAAICGVDVVSHAKGGRPIAGAILLFVCGVCAGIILFVEVPSDKG